MHKTVFRFMLAASVSALGIGSSISGSADISLLPMQKQDLPMSTMTAFRPGQEGFGNQNSKLIPVDRCGATEYSCDEYGSPDCRWDNSMDAADNGNWFCAPYSVIHCAVRYEWDYWCASGNYCCTGGCCQ